MSLRRIARQSWIAVLHWTGLIRWAKFRLRRSGAVTVLTFHRVLDDLEFASTNSVPGMVMRSRTYRALCKYVSKSCHPVSLSEASTSIGARDQRPRIAFTFDDAWYDTAAIAYPIAREHEIPIAVFTCPSLVDRDRPFWPEEAVALLKPTNLDPHSRSERIEELKRAGKEAREHILQNLRTSAATIDPGNAGPDRTMSWDDIADLSRSGVTIGSHTDSHPILTQIPSDQVSCELERSKRSLEAALNRECDTLAYPNGDYSPAVRDAAQRAGYRLAFTTKPGVWNANTDNLAIPRINAWEGAMVGKRGEFSQRVFDYTVFWRAYRSERTSK